ncbi:MAG TPA: hypothetical protein VE953_27930 [Terriglobales bacterium]|nr:hypothetical protein [Terriglobales bacterium]
MNDASGTAEGSLAADEAAAPTEEEGLSDGPASDRRRRWRWREWLSSGLFALVVVCFALPFASATCTAPGGYGRGAQGTSTVYRGFDLALDAVPAVTPGDRAPRPESLPNDGQLGVQPLALLALVAALVGIALAWSHGARVTAAYAAFGAVLLVAAQLTAVDQIASRIGDRAALPSGKSQGDFVGTGLGFLLALLLLAIVAAVNVVAAVWRARRIRRAPAPELTRPA